MSLNAGANKIIRIKCFKSESSCSYLLHQTIAWNVKWIFIANSRPFLIYSGYEQVTLFYELFPLRAELVNQERLADELFLQRHPRNDSYLLGSIVSDRLGALLQNNKTKYAMTLDFRYTYAVLPLENFVAKTLVLHLSLVLQSLQVTEN